MRSHLISVTRKGQVVGELSAEHIPLEYPDMSWRADPAIGRDASGKIYAAIRLRVFSSRDGGRSWFSREVAVKDSDPRLAGKGQVDINCYDSFGVLRDGTLLWAYALDGDNYLLRSTDGGETWEPWSKIEDKSPYGYAGGNQNCMTELPDGTVLWPTRLSPGQDEEFEKRTREAFERKQWQGPPFWTTFVYRSTDSGRTWPEKWILQPWGCETNLLHLRSGRLLASIRYQRHRFAPVPANEPEELRRVAESAVGGDALFSGKRVFFADSEDGGRTWANFRPLSLEKGGRMDLEHGEAHGHATQLADGRVLVVHEHRYPYDKGDIRARVTHDEGQTWRPEVYHLSQGHGYAASVQIDDGTIVTVCGNTPLDARGEPTVPWRAEVVRWHLLDEA